MAIPIIPRGEVAPEERPAFHKHACPPTFSGDNPDLLPSTVSLKRNLLVNFDLALPGGGSVPMWIIEDPDDLVNGRTFPSRPIRVTEGDIVHVTVGNQGNTHTIHWHGIEPSPVNDGVGKHSFEVSGSFVYQWLAAHAGTYFYHCHKNTTLHVEMGLYGALIIDPPQGQGFVAAFNPSNPAGHVTAYDVEAIWAVDEIDSVWHSLGHNAHMQTCTPDDPAGASTFTNDGMLNNFRPDIFVITGVPRADDATPITDARVAVNAQAGQTILIRVLNAGYTVQQYTLGLDATVIAMDGRALGVPPFSSFSFPFTVPAGTPFKLTSARRWDLLLKPTSPGVYPAMVEFLDWVNGTKYATARTTITVA
jgi:FtsP/CotA-like multicopper oxidase with cupredoxin domain